MPAYMLTFLRVEDAEVHARDYLPAAHQILLDYGGKPLAVTENSTSRKVHFQRVGFFLLSFPQKKQPPIIMTDRSTGHTRRSSIRFQPATWSSSALIRVHWTVFQTDWIDLRPHPEEPHSGVAKEA